MCWQVAALLALVLKMLQGLWRQLVSAQEARSEWADVVAVLVNVGYTDTQQALCCTGQADCQRLHVLQRVTWHVETLFQTAPLYLRRATFGVGLGFGCKLFWLSTAAGRLCA